MTEPGLQSIKIVKDATSLDISNLAAKCDFVTLKTEVGKLDIKRFQMLES